MAANLPAAQIWDHRDRSAALASPHSTDLGSRKIRCDATRRIAT
jgi:hypothetical protein